MDDQAYSFMENEIRRGESSDGKLATVSKATFRYLFWTLLVVFVIVGWILAAALSRILGVRDEQGWFGGVVVINIVLARLAADGILKRMGMSLSGKTVEVPGRVAAVPEGDVLGWTSPTIVDLRRETGHRATQSSRIA